MREMKWLLSIQTVMGDKRVERIITRHELKQRKWDRKKRGKKNNRKLLTKGDEYNNNNIIIQGVSVTLHSNVTVVSTAGLLDERDHQRSGTFFFRKRQIHFLSKSVTRVRTCVAVRRLFPSVSQTRFFSSSSGCCVVIPRVYYTTAISKKKREKEKWAWK